jgi:hypothetical protein
VNCHRVSTSNLHGKRSYTKRSGNLKVLAGSEVTTHRFLQVRCWRACFNVSSSFGFFSKINLLLWVVSIKTLLARNEIVSGYGHDIIVNSQMTT